MISSLLKFLIISLSIFWLQCDQISIPYDLVKGSDIEPIAQFKISDGLYDLHLDYYNNHLFISSQDTIFILSLQDHVSPRRVRTLVKKSSLISISPPYLYTFHPNTYPYYPCTLEAYNITNPSSPIYEDRLVFNDTFNIISTTGSFVVLLELPGSFDTTCKMVVIKNENSSLQITKTYILNVKEEERRSGNEILLCPFDESTLYIIWGEDCSMLKLNLNSLDTTRYDFMEKEYKEMESIYAYNSNVYILGHSLKAPRRSEFGIGKIAGSNFRKLSSVYAYISNIDIEFVSNNYAYLLSHFNEELFIYTISGKDVYQIYYYNPTYTCDGVVEIAGYTYVLSGNFILIFKL
jgi:hypothetical protein